MSNFKLRNIIKHMRKLKLWIAFLIGAKVSLNTTSLLLDLNNYDFQNDIVNHNQICTYKKYKFIRPFMDEQWNKARKLLNLSHRPDSEFYMNTKKFQKKHSYFIDKFYHFDDGIHLFQVNQTIIVYLRLFKCGSESIMGNLNKYMLQEGCPQDNRSVVFRLNNEYLKFKNKLKTNTLDTFSGFYKPIDLSSPFLRVKHHQLKVFTYVRHPVKKLESGLAEVITRNSDLIANNVSIKLLRKWFTDMLDYKILYPMDWFQHIYPMCGALFRYDVDIILTQENFATNWDQIIVPTYNLHYHKFDNSLGFHKSSIQHPLAKENIKNNIKLHKKTLYAYNFRRLFRSIQTEDPNLWVALCHLLVMEFVCLPQYKLPKSCQHLHSDVEKGIAMLHQTNKI